MHRCPWTPRSSSARWIGPFVALALLAAESPARAAPAKPAADTTEYVIRAGDTCRSLSRRHFPDDPEALRKWHALNPLGPSPHKLKPGMKVRVPSRDPDARIAYLRPLVKVRPRAKLDWKDAASGLGLFRLDSVNTLAEAHAEIHFRDESWLRMRENALIVIYGGATPREVRHKSGAVELVQGDLRMGLAELRGEPVRVAASSARVEAMSRDLEVGVDVKKKSRVSVFDGFAQVTAGGRTVRVNEGFGTTVEPGRPPAQPESLPPAPLWGDGDSATLVLVDYGDGAEGELSWDPVNGASRYRLELAADEKLTRVAASQTTLAPSTMLKLPGLEPGVFYAGLSAANAAGLWSPVSTPRKVVVARVQGLKGRRAKTHSGFRATGTLYLTSDTPNLALHVDGRPAPLPATVRGAGLHELRFTLGGEESEASLTQVSIEPPRARLSIHREGKDVWAVAELFDLQGAPYEASLSEIEIRGKSGASAEAVERFGIGDYRARLVPGKARPARFEVLWDRLVLAQTTLSD